jgi:MYXO-CTERM domain-containing protein
VRQEFSQIMAMPTPGALALVAVSALVGTRRRR